MLETIDIVGLDFDRTLAGHRYPTAGRVPATTYEQEVFECLTHLKEHHAGDYAPGFMKWFVKYAMEHGKYCFGLSHEIFNLRSEYKKSFILEHYGKMDYYEVNSPEHKIDFLRGLARAKGIPPEDYSRIMLVEDRMETVHLACLAGFSGVHITNVCENYERMLNGKPTYL